MNKLFVRELSATTLFASLFFLLFGIFTFSPVQGINLYFISTITALSMFAVKMIFGQNTHIDPITTLGIAIKEKTTSELLPRLTAQGIAWIAGFLIAIAIGSAWWEYTTVSVIIEDPLWLQVLIIATSVIAYIIASVFSSEFSRFKHSIILSIGVVFAMFIALVFGYPMMPFIFGVALLGLNSFGEVWVIIATSLVLIYPTVMIGKLVASFD